MHATQQDATEGAAADDPQETEFNREIRRLAALTTAAYERERIPAAKRLGVRAAGLDKLVAAERKDDCKVGQGKPLELPEPEPWPGPVDGAALIDEIEDAIKRYVFLPKDAAFTSALWVLHGYCFDAFTCTPRLAITAPEKRCGKTTLLDVLTKLVPRSLPTANISAAAVFRTIETKRPVLLIDEADTFLGESEDLRGILNSGHRAGGQVVRTVGDDHEPRAFSTFCPVAIAQIGKLPGTLADRSISIEMKRRTSSEKVARFQHRKTPELDKLACKAARWVADNAAAIRVREPRIPEAIFNRTADNWEPLLSIAEVAGDEVAERTRRVALAACGVEEEQSLSAALLADIRDIFAEKGLTEGDEYMRSADLVTALIAMPERSWGECNHGKALTQNGLARRLKPFDIFTKGIGPEQKRVKGYTLESFADAFKRYLPPIATAQPHSSNENNDLDEKQTAQPVYDCAVANEPNTLNANDLCGCADENPQNGDACECADDLPPGDRENSVNGGLEENEASPTQSRQAIARALMREANRQGADLHLDKNGDLKRREVPLDPAFLMKLKEFKLQIIATLQNGGGWNDRS